MYLNSKWYQFITGVVGNLHRLFSKDLNSVCCRKPKRIPCNTPQVTTLIFKKIIKPTHGNKLKPSKNLFVGNIDRLDVGFLIFIVVFLIQLVNFFF